MASSFIASINFAIEQIVIYIAIPIFILGVIGGVLNVVVFLSLKTFRQSSCAFYLMIMSSFDVGRFFSNVLAYIMRWGFGTDWGLSSIVFCRMRSFLFSTCTLSSMTCLCLAIVDQYFATSSRPRWQKWCNIKLAYWITAIFIIIWTLHGIPYLIFFDQIISPSTNQIICRVTNAKFLQYITYGYFLILTNLIPLITVIFGLMSYHNARHIARRTVPLVRRELDKQMTVMVFVQVLINSCIFLPYSIINMFIQINLYQSDPVFTAKANLTSTIITIIYLCSFASPFYTYVCVSKRFRRQLKHVLFEMHVKRCRPNKIPINQVVPEITTNR